MKTSLAQSAKAISKEAGLGIHVSIPFHLFSELTKSYIQELYFPVGVSAFGSFDLRRNGDCWSEFDRRNIRVKGAGLGVLRSVMLMFGIGMKIK
jgi:hypothetical protein